jgi:hypothetical protein
MKSINRTIVKTALIATVAIGLAILIWPQAVSAAFDIKQGIVGNLSPDCRLNGNCGWCDFIDLMAILQRVILSIFGGVALIMLIWAGQGMIMAGGNQEKVSASKKLITSTLLGVLFILIGYFLINAVVSVLINPTDNTGPRLRLYGSDWFIASCVVTDPTDSKYCERKPTGTPCKNNQTGDWVCENDKCDAIICQSLKQVDPKNDYSCRDKCETPFTDTSGRGYCPTSTECCFKPEPTP